MLPEQCFNPLIGNFTPAVTNARSAASLLDICWQWQQSIESPGQNRLAKLTKPSIMATSDVIISKLTNIE
jgi:hypothetical protein